eukprot:8366086-Prorocentrum_lima.AAC.1
MRTSSVRQRQGGADQPSRIPKVNRVHFIIAQSPGPAASASAFGRCHTGRAANGAVGVNGHSDSAAALPAVRSAHAAAPSTA